MALHFKKAIDLATELNRDANHDEFYQGKNFMVKINGTTNYAEILVLDKGKHCLLYTSPSPRDGLLSRMPSSA